MIRKGLSGLVRLLLLSVLISLQGFAFVGDASAAGIIYVKQGSGGANDGSSWANAYHDLQDALAAAASGDQIWVATGEYLPTSTTDRTLSFQLKNGVAVYGGFAGTETLLSQRNPALHPSILSGEIGDPGFVTDNSHHVVTASSIGGTAVLDGFKITRAYEASVCADSGAMYSLNASPALSNLTFSGNTGYCGGGIHNNASSPILKYVTFNGNKGHFGGGMYNEALSAPKLTDVTFSGNSALLGGGMANTASGATLVNATFSGNSDVGIISDGSFLFVHESVFWGDALHEIYISNPGGPNTIADSIVQGGCPSYASCTRVLNADPKLGPLQNNGGLTSTRALRAGSAAIDKGNNSTCAAKDQRGVARPQGVKCDLGAYEVRVISFTSTGANDGWVLESGENTTMGGSKDAGSATLRVGDDASNKQYRSVVSFDTSGLPDGAAVVLARVKVMKAAIVGMNPLTTHGTLTLDLKTPFFGGALGLEVGDFQAASTVTPAGSIGPGLVGGGYLGLLNSAGRAAVNKTGTTQLRLRFAIDDNNDHGADFLSLYSGNATYAYRPVLIVYYNP